jgi:membrane protease YdiL (CAAX protease family)
MLSGYLAMISAFAVIFSPETSWFVEQALLLSDAWLYTPASLPLALTGGWQSAVIGAFVLVAFGALVPFVTILAAEHFVRDGVVVGSGSLQGPRMARVATPSRGGLFRGVVKKELRALIRDRQLRTQAFVMPVMVAVFQIWLNPSLLETLGSNPRHLATAAFGTAMIPLLTGALGGLAMESPALPLLYAAPVSLERLLAAKVRVWVGVAWLFAAIVFVGIWLRTPALFLPSLPHVPLVFVGIVLYAVIALGIGALGTDPLEVEPRRRIRVSAAYLYMVLAGLFGYALYSPSPWAKIVQVALSTLLAFALWQKLRDHLPYVLDPTDAPPPSIAVADGLIAALGFFVLQGLGLVFFGGGEGSRARELFVAFAWAGVLTTLVSVWWFHRNRLPDLARALGLRAPKGGGWLGGLRALAAGTFAGLGAAAIGLFYQTLVVHIPGAKQLLEEASHFSGTELAGGGRYFFFVVAVVAAPLFEEFIFRGILYTGFRRSLRSTGAALASSAVFALVHPAVSVVPVFVMAFVAAKTYEKFRWLGAPIATHMAYNGVIVGVALASN